jgi:hypothetical protein
MGWSTTFILFDNGVEKIIPKTANVKNMQSDDDNMPIQIVQKRSKATQEKSLKNKKLRSAKNKEKC